MATPLSPDAPGTSRSAPATPASTASSGPDAQALLHCASARAAGDEPLRRGLDVVQELDAPVLAQLSGTSFVRADEDRASASSDDNDA